MASCWDGDLGEWKLHWAKHTGGTRDNDQYLNSTNSHARATSSRWLPFTCPYSSCHFPGYFETCICRIHTTAQLAWKMSKCPFTPFFITFPPPTNLQWLGIRKLNFLPLSWSTQGQSPRKRNLQALPSNAPSSTLTFKKLPKISSQNLRLFKG